MTLRVNNDNSNFNVVPNNVIIMCGDKEMIKLKPNGDIYVKGNLVESDIEVVDGMRELLHCHKIKRSE